MTSAFVSAATIDEALSALAGGARPVAGGTDLVVGARQGKTPLPESLVAIHRLDELRGEQLSGDELRLGALVSHADIADDALVCERLTALADASSIVGSRATRVQGTLGGNLMNASPAMEVGGPLMVFGATVVLRSDSGDRHVAVSELLTGPGTTVATAGELLTEVDDPAPGRRAGQLLCATRVPPADGDRGRRCDGGSSQSRTGQIASAGNRDHGTRADDQARPGSGGCARRQRRRPRRRRARRLRPPRPPPSRSRTSVRRPTTVAPWRRS